MVLLKGENGLCSNIDAVVFSPSLQDSGRAAPRYNGGYAGNNVACNVVPHPTAIDDGRLYTTKGGHCFLSESRIVFLPVLNTPGGRRTDPTVTSWLALCATTTADIYTKECTAIAISRS